MSYQFHYKLFKSWEFVNSPLTSWTSPVQRGLRRRFWGGKKKNIPPDENKNLTCKNWKKVKHHYPILKENKQTNSTGYRWLEDAMPSRVLSSCPLSPCIVWAGGKTDFSFCLAVSSYTLLTVSMVRFQEQLHYTKRGEKIKKIKI